MAKLESNIKNMIISLSLISAVMSFALGFVYLKTKGPIEIAQKAKVNDAIKKVVPIFDNDPGKESFSIDEIICYPAKKSDSLVGMAIETFSMKGFAGRISLMVGFLPDGIINKIEVLEQKETPGLGTKMKEPRFKDQFNGKNLSTYKAIVKKDGGDVDAITASTISSRAFCEAITKAYNTFKKGVKHE